METNLTYEEIAGLFNEIRQLDISFTEKLETLRTRLGELNPFIKKLPDDQYQAIAVLKDNLKQKFQEKINEEKYPWESAKPRNDEPVEKSNLLDAPIDDPCEKLEEQPAIKPIITNTALAGLKRLVEITKMPKALEGVIESAKEMLDVDKITQDDFDELETMVKEKRKVLNN